MSNDYGSVLFEKIAIDLIEHGFCVLKDAIPSRMATELQAQVKSLQASEYKQAGVGRGAEKIENMRIRRDEICWIDGKGCGEQSWLTWMNELQCYLNRRLFLGLFSFESHFAHYAAGDFYAKHYDAFKGQVNRILTVTAYLNSNWEPDFGGALLIYGDRDKGQEERVIDTVLPELGTIVIFLSELFPHEVLPANQDRYSIAGWFRVNNADKNSIDPPV